MSLIEKVNDIKKARDEIKAIIDDLRSIYKTFEDTLKTKGLDFLYGEIYRHALEMVDELTDEVIEEKFK